MFSDLVLKTRTIRRFDRSKVVTDADLNDILAPVANVASAGNLQRLRYVTLNGDAALGAFSNISLGGFLPDDKKPTVDVAPSAYVIITSKDENPDPNLMIDVGIAAQTIALCASEKGIGACMIRNFKREYFASLMPCAFSYPVLVIALGYPAEKAEISRASDGESLKYYKNENDINVVPKLSIDSLVIGKIDKM